MDREKKLIIETLQSKKTSNLMEVWCMLPKKVSKESIKARLEGNNLFAKPVHNSQVHEEIWKLYSKSIAKAPNNSEDLALAYGNRSALLFHLQNYQDCINDVDRALKITNSNSLKVKLFCRKIDCLTALKKCETAPSYEEIYKYKLQETKRFLDDIQDKNEKDRLLEHVNKSKVSLEIHKSKTCEKEISKDFLEKVSINNCSSSDSLTSDINKTQKILSEKKSADPFDNVYLKENKKYSRHLVANQDIKPGEIIMVVKPYTSCLNVNNFYAYCSHCLKISWSTIPCDHCSLFMFCSEKCKIEAWQQYHNIECSVIPYMMLNEDIDYFRQLALKSVLIAINEAGSIEKLKDELIKFDNYKNKMKNKFLDKKFYNNQFQSIYNLSTNDSIETLEKYIDQTVMILVALAKSTSLFGNKVKFNDNKDLLNENVIFVGSLLLKLLKISAINTHSIMEGSSFCRFSNQRNQCEKIYCCERGTSLAVIPSMINHSCYPNVRKCFTEDMHLIVYAIQPIKKNVQLFDSYIGFFFDKNISERQSLLQSYNFICSCPPCKENWQPISLMKYPICNKRKEDVELEQQLFEKYKDIIISKKDDDISFSLNTIDNLSQAIEETTTQLTQPSRLIVALISSLWTAFDYVYGIKLQINDKCN